MLPTCQEGFQNHDKVYYAIIKNFVRRCHVTYIVRYQKDNEVLRLFSFPDRLDLINLTTLGYNFAPTSSFPWFEFVLL